MWSEVQFNLNTYLFDLVKTPFENISESPCCFIAIINFRIQEDSRYI